MNEEQKVILEFEGITLISLVITIVILIILASVAIYLSLGNNGIFTRAKQAKNIYMVATNEEEKELSKIDIDKYATSITSFEEMLKICGIKTEYTIKDVKENKDGILDKILENTNAVDYIISNPNYFLKEFVSSEIAIEKLSTVGNIKEKIIKNEIWLKEIQNSVNAEVFDKNMKTIPIMTSNNTPSGEVIANKYNYDPYLAFDNNATTFFYNGSKIGNLIYKYDEIKFIYKISINISNPASESSNNVFKIYISSEDNGENWKEIKSEEWTWASGHVTEKRIETVTLKKAEKVKRIKIYSSNARKTYSSDMGSTSIWYIKK